MGQRGLLAGLPRDRESLRAGQRAHACYCYLDSPLGRLKYGAENMEKWQTEQGFFACVYGAYQPRIQGRWTMTEMMMYEQFAIPKEHNHLWYDVSHGFWDSQPGGRTTTAA